MAVILNWGVNCAGRPLLSPCWYDSYGKGKCESCQCRVFCTFLCYIDCWPTHKTISHHNWSTVSFGEVNYDCSKVVLRMKHAFVSVEMSVVGARVVCKYCNHWAVLSNEQLFSLSTSLQYHSQSACRICQWHNFNDSIPYLWHHASLLHDMASRKLQWLGSASLGFCFLCE